MSAKIITALLCAAALLSAWMLRWEIIVVQQHDDSPSYAYALDRWTGQIRYLQDASWIAVDEVKK